MTERRQVDSITRRRFLMQSAAMAAFPTVMSTSGSLHAAVRGSANDRITMGLIGCGGMGNSLLNSFLRQSEVQIVAVCDPDRDRRVASRRSVERHYAEQARTGTFRGCVDCNDYRELLARSDIDAVILGSPDHWHALQTVHAARAGKDIYCEKPLSITVREGRMMSDTVAAYGRVFQTGSQQRSDARFRRACEIVRNGHLGIIRRVTCYLPKGETTGNHPPKPVPDGFDYDLWLGPAPFEPYCDRRTHYDFRHNLDYSGGKLTDWGAHHIDIAQWALGEVESGPVRMRGTGTFPKDGLWNAAIEYHLEATYRSGVELVIVGHERNGIEFIGDHGRLFVTRGTLTADPPELLEVELASSDLRLPVSNHHHADFLQCVRSRQQTVAPVEHAHRSISIAHLGNIAMLLGRELRWDPVSERFMGDSTADSMLHRAMRAPYTW